MSPPRYGKNPLEPVFRTFPLREACHLTAKVFLKIPYVLIHVTLLALAGQVVVSLLLSAIRSRSLAREDRGASEEGAGVWVGYGATGHEAEKENGRQLRCEGCKAVLDATP